MHGFPQFFVYLCCFSSRWVSTWSLLWSVSVTSQISFSSVSNAGRLLCSLEASCFLPSYLPCPPVPGSPADYGVRACGLHYSVHLTFCLSSGSGNPQELDLGDIFVLISVSFSLKLSALVWSVSVSFSLLWFVGREVWLWDQQGLPWVCNPIPQKIWC